MSANSLARRLEKLERPAHLPGDCLWLCCTGQDVLCWRGGRERDQRAWHRRDGEDPEAFRARVRAEALPAGIFCLIGLEEKEPIDPATSGN